MGSVYGLLATACGYSYPLIDAMTLPQVEELFAYWAAHPPLHLIAAAYLGIKPKPPRPASMAEILALPGIERRPVDDGLPAPVLDFAELRRDVVEKWNKHA